MVEDLVLKFIKFSLVGSSGLVIDFGTTWLVKEVLRGNKYLANSLGFTLAVVNNYIWNKYWTFQDTDPAVFAQFGKFLTISLIGLLINNLVIYVFERYMNFYRAKIIAILIVVIWNFIMNYTFAFTQS